MAELARIEFLSTSEGLEVRCNGSLEELLPTLTMGAADLMRSFAPRMGTTEAEAAGSFVAAFQLAMHLAPDMPRVDLSPLASMLRKLREEGEQRGQK